MSGTGPAVHTGKPESKDAFGPGTGMAHDFGLAMGKKERGVKPEHFKKAVDDKVRGDLVATALRGDPLASPRENTFPLVAIEHDSGYSRKPFNVLAELTLEEFARIRAFTKNVGLRLFSIPPDERRIPQLGKDWQPHIKGMVIRRDQKYLLNGRQLIFEGWHDEWRSHPDGLIVRCAGQFALYSLKGKRSVVYDGPHDEWWVHPKGVLIRRGDTIYLNGVQSVYRGPYKAVRSCLTGVVIEVDYTTDNPRTEWTGVYLLSPYDRPNGDNGRDWVQLYGGPRAELDWKLMSEPSEHAPAELYFRLLAANEDGAEVGYTRHHLRLGVFQSGDHKDVAAQNWFPHPEGIVLKNDGITPGGPFNTWVTLHRGLEERTREERVLYFGFHTQIAPHPYGVIIRFGGSESGYKQPFILA